MQSADAILRLENVGKTFPGVVALNGITLELQRGETHIILGENGAGKSTLIKLLAGIYQPDTGEIFLNGRPYKPKTPHDAQVQGIRIVHQELNLLSHLSIAENLMLESLPKRFGIMDRATLNRRAEELLAEVGLAVDPRMPVSELGVAQMQLVEIAKALGYDSKLLVLDEPTATLTPPEIERLFAIIKRLKAKGVTIIYISHRLHEVFEIGDRVTVLRNGRLVETRDLQGLSVPDLVRMMIGRDIADEYGFNADIKLGSVALEVRNVKRNSGAPPVSFSVRHGEILGVAGLVGSGRTEVMRAIFGADPRSAGEIDVDGRPVTIRDPRDAVRNGLGFLTEDRKSQGLLLDMPVSINTTITDLKKISHGGLLDSRVEKGAVTELVERLRVKTASIDTPVRNLSGGNQQKVVLAKWLFRGSSTLILDEPTRGVDVGARREIYQLLWMLAANQKAIIMISSDLPELIGMCHRIIVFSNGKLVGELDRSQFDQERILSLAYQEHVHA
ncbi:sugar ABC transporter ATP-binding protein [Brucella anthropi]|uniref:Sugar ABC transporter ATP-binding protein n=1 Tax=Brucella anthropi TaxID=529 RepID=A0A6I0DBP8_BRUAN|nr:sugar ABC transporter ATP-binding protein [Brucella anthropi]QTN05777.1 ATP-binding cassette domain-containing protein [Ochrobactrum sp. EEELCW01]KAB2736291.1 sugar ABC transporter ATP-binding protein [Brucella anthropi]KAB2769928.1 sugar ABC transporter ATP-binding protein [Brucella anthropi]KAB2785238.1 sugar ABC transporter ATP-binding protein [Brucella anthropi]UVV69572.1 sugar ABC transporter ATP-binding protein [Brucella anthropi]